MTTRDWRRADQYQSDAATYPGGHAPTKGVPGPLPPQHEPSKAKLELMRKQAQLAKDTQRQKDREAADRAKARSLAERKRLRRVLNKYGPKLAIHMGVPRAMVDAYEAEKRTTIVPIAGNKQHKR